MLAYLLSTLTAAVAGGAALATAFPPEVAAVWPLCLAFYAILSTFVASGLASHYPHASLGWCNILTQGRLTIVVVLTAPLFATLSHWFGGASGGGVAAGGWMVAGLALGALALDGVDGWFARRQRLSSQFGARFDMEVDSLLALTLALHAWASGAVGPAVLVLGSARYVFAAAAWAVPWLGRPLPDRLSRKAVCVVQVSVLIAVQTPLLPETSAEALAVGAVVAVLWSFGRDIRWLYLRRQEHRPG